MSLALRPISMQDAKAVVGKWHRLHRRTDAELHRWAPQRLFVPVRRCASGGGGDGVSAGLHIHPQIGIGGIVASCGIRDGRGAGTARDLELSEPAANADGFVRQRAATGRGEDSMGLAGVGAEETGGGGNRSDQLSKKIVKFIPVKHGDQIEIGDTGLLGVSGTNKLVGFKPGRAGKREGWLVVLSADNAKSPRRKMK